MPLFADPITYDGSPIASLKKLVLETTLQTLEKQRHFFSLIQDRILYVLQGRPSEEDAYDEEEREGEAQLQIIQTLQLQLHNHLKAIDISSKAKRVQQKLRMFVESDSLADRDMEAKLSAMEPLIDELLDAATELPDLDELTELIGQVHLTYRKFTKDVLRATPVKDVDPTTSHPDARKQPLYRLTKTDMPTFEGDPGSSGKDSANAYLCTQTSQLRRRSRNSNRPSSRLQEEHSSAHQRE